MPKKPTPPRSRTGHVPTPVTAHTHADARANIPTEELRDFIADEERNPKTRLYPRDPSLDPQLVWKGKDEQDATDLAVPAVPIYIQEHIKPQAIVELVRQNPPSPGGRGAGGEGFQLGLFADFNGLDFAERVDFYHHEQHWTNRMILGDSLLVMTSLAEKEGLKGKVQMIYFDPPYGIKFGSNWQVSTRKRDVKDGKAEDATRQPEQVKAFRDTWQLGIHSYLSYLRDRLVTARELLTESGSIFVQIGDENVHLVRNVLDEVFGSENFVAQITFKKTGGFASDTLALIGDLILWYSKNKSAVKYRQLFLPKEMGEGSGERYTTIELEDGTSRPVKDDEVDGQVAFPMGARLLLGAPLTSDGPSSSPQNFVFNNKPYFPKGNQHWKTSVDGLVRLSKAGRIFETKSFLNYKLYIDDFAATPLANMWTDTMGTAERNKVYVVQTQTKVIERCMLMSTDPGDLVLDPTCGSGTTAYVAEQWGRRWITLDTSRVAIALARTRLMAGRFPYYLLADSAEGQKKEQELNPQTSYSQGISPIIAEETKNLRSSAPSADIKRGLVYKRVPHITLKSIANNEEIDTIHAKYQPRLEDLCAKINAARRSPHPVGEGPGVREWQEWEIPRQTSEISQTSEVSHLLAEYWQVRRERQREIDASIARRADVEMLYDQPYEDPKRIRVAGPFTVESLSPHRVLSADSVPAGGYADGADKEKNLRESAQSADFVSVILENLKSAGVQNTVKNQRLKFTRLDPYAGIWLHAVGEYTEQLPSPASGGGPGVRVRRVAVSIGPELGTVSADQVKEAAKEAVMGVGFDLLIICGFAFDPHVSEEAKRYGRLTVLPTRMNPDLAMGDELLKRTGAGNLFMVFGEPDVEIRPYNPQIFADKNKKENLRPSASSADEKIVVEIKGVDVYDPTTGEIRSNSTDDIACWFIDTDYNEECFIVRHAYFTGADEPYEKLKRALRAEIDESAWSALYQTTSYPFEKPKSGKIAVKVINHYGDEVLKVFDVSSH